LKHKISISNDLLVRRNPHLMARSGRGFEKIPRVRKVMVMDGIGGPQLSLPIASTSLPFLSPQSHNISCSLPYKYFVTGKNCHKRSLRDAVTGMVTARIVKAQADWGLAIFTLKKGESSFFGGYYVGSSRG
jgi:hypothetical protein